GHHVLVSAPHFESSNKEIHKFGRVVRHELEKNLVASGLNEEKARRLALDSGGSLTVVKRRLARYPTTRQPVWSQPPYSSNLVPLLLAGSWDDASAADQEAIAKLSGRPYAEVLKDATRWAGGDDPPLRRVGSNWSINSRDDAFMLLSQSITRQDL